MYTYFMPTRRVGGKKGRKPVRIIGALLYCKCVFLGSIVYFDILTLPDQAQVTLQMTVFPI